MNIWNFLKHRKLKFEERFQYEENARLTIKLWNLVPVILDRFVISAKFPEIKE